MLGLAVTMRSAPARPALRLARTALLLWIVAVVTVPALTVALIDAGTRSGLHVEPGIHSVMESFCGLIALLIATMLLSGQLQRQDAGSRTFGLAFFCMGTLDLLHAFTSPTEAPDLFVAFHTLSTLSGSLIITAGLLIQVTRGERLTRQDLLFGATALGLLLLVGYASETHMSRWIEPGSGAGHHAFSAGSHNLHRLAGGLYGISAILVYLHYHRTRELLSLFVAAILLLYAQSAFLFAVSNMWSFTWWLWHGAKLVLYFGVLVTVFLGLQIALEALARFGLQLTRVNTDLRSAESQVLRINKELENRNDMVRDAMASFHLNHTMGVVSRAVHQLVPVERCELVLDLPEDEVAEFDRMIGRLGSPWFIKGQAEGSGPFEQHDDGVDVLPCDAPSSTAGVDCVSLALSTAGNRIGHLRLVGVDPVAQQEQLASALSLTAEIGPIVNNAMLYHRWLDANEFQSALLEVSPMLTSTLNLGAVLHTVCTESARLLDSDAGLVWLTAEDGTGFTSVSSAFEDNDAQDSGQLAIWLQHRMVGDEMLRGPDGRYRPQALLVGGREAATSAADSDGIRDWGALALFPLTEESYLVGVMVLLRKEPVAYSATSLAKGELLAEQVRIAVNNARTYRRLDEINRQLQASEESRARAEQLTFLGHMAASIAHEVRNPLSAMANCLSVLSGNCKFDDKGEAALEIIRDELDRLNKLTHDFLLFGKPGVAPATPVMLAKVLETTCANLERHVAQQALPIVVQRSARGCAHPIMIDPGGVETVLWNLLLNAAQAIDGPGTIRASVHQTPGHILISVSDTGAGIPFEERQKIFEPFYSRKSHGVGLGLSIVSRFVKSWQGSIRIVSQPGRGTAFVIRAPIPTAGEPALASS